MKGEDMMCVMREEAPALKKVDLEILTKLYSFESDSENNELVLADVPRNFYDLISQEMYFLTEEHERITDKNEKFSMEHLMADEKQFIQGILDRRTYKVVIQSIFKADSDAQMDFSRYSAEEKELFDQLVPVIKAHYDRMRKKCMI